MRTNSKISPVLRRTHWKDKRMNKAEVRFTRMTIQGRLQAEMGEGEGNGEGVVAKSQ